MDIARLQREGLCSPVHALGMVIGICVLIQHHLACDGASESSVAAAVGSGLGRAHMLPIIQVECRLSRWNRKNVSRGSLRTTAYREGTTCRGRSCPHWRRPSRRCACPASPCRYASAHTRHRSPCKPCERSSARPAGHRRTARPTPWEHSDRLRRSSPCRSSSSSSCAPLYRSPLDRPGPFQKNVTGKFRVGGTPVSTGFDPYIVSYKPPRDSKKIFKGLQLNSMGLLNIKRGVSCY